MCGQVGIIFGKKRRRIAEREYLNEVFIRMLLSSEQRGPHASGVALLQTDGEFRLFKRPVRAHRIIREPDFHELMDEVSNRTTVLMGHTRWRTRGSESNSRNNHPIRAGNIIGTHNGTIYNADQLFCRFQLPRYAEVDSELIFRLADCFTSAHGFNEAGFRKALRLCRGQMSAVLASRHDPRAITVLKGNKPLTLRYSRKHRAVLYASEAEFIDSALDDPRGWQDLEIPQLTMLSFNHEDLQVWEQHPFEFICQERTGTLPQGVIA
jgi:glucosamine 6-phosphate synthetase-like amidotransferase/phosphosugar isomerase protein